MLRRFLVGGTLTATLALVAASFLSQRPAAAQQPSPNGATGQVVPVRAEVGNQPPSARRTGVAADPIVIPNSKLAVIVRQEVPAQREGMLDFIGREVRPGEVVSAHLRTWEGPDGKKYRELREDDEVKQGDLMARLDTRLAVSEVNIKKAKLDAAIADHSANEKLTEEGLQRWQTQVKLWQSRATNVEDLRGAEVTYRKYQLETVSKKAAIESARAKLKQTETILEMHDITSKINGRIKTIYKQLGEAVKNQDTVFQVYHYEKLRVEGVVPTQYSRSLHNGMRVVVEPTIPEGPEQTLRGHRQEITGVAVSNDAKAPLIVSASADGTVRVWERATRHQRREYQHPAAVRAVACNPPGAAGHLCLSGAADGVGRLFDLNSPSEDPILELKGQHRVAINCVAFSQDGRLCATGSEDKSVCIWDTATGALKSRGTDHRGPVTSVQFLKGGQFLSAGRDKKVILWKLTDGALEVASIIDRPAGGDVHQLVASNDGRWVMIDQGREIRLLALPGRTVEGSLQNPVSEGGNFTTMALFSPDSKLALTAGLSDGRLQLWRLPTEKTRPYELRQLVSPERSTPTCGAFSPDGSFLVTGSRDRQVYVWAMPTKEEIEHQLTAVVTYIERAVDSGSRQEVRIWAELDNKDGRLIPGWNVTMVAYPGKE